ncbi:MAG: DUF6728 family protein [Bacteroidota bacterium]
MPVQEDLTKEERENRNQNTNDSIKHFLGLGEVFGYFFRKKDPNRPSNFNIRMMHGINKISIMVFLFGIIFILIKKFIL